MFGLAILFFLALWVVGVLLAMYLCGMVGGKLGAKVGVPLVGGLFGIALGFTLPMGRVFLGWAQEKIDAETTVAGLCATKAGIRIYLSPEEHARRIRENDWEGVKRAEVKDRDLGSITFGKVITLDGRKFGMSDKDFSGENGSIVHLMTGEPEEYPRYIFYFNKLIYDVAHQVPLAFVDGFQINDYSGRPKMRFWLNSRRGCGYYLLRRASKDLTSKYKTNLNQEEKK